MYNQDKGGLSSFSEASLENINLDSHEFTHFWLVCVCVDKRNTLDFSNLISIICSICIITTDKNVNMIFT